jgi:hypoxanthine phosphoribosyltransferase
MTISKVTEMRQVMLDADCIFTPEEVEAAIERMAIAITERLEEANPLVLCVMHGGLITAGRLLPRLLFPLECGYIHATRYGHEQFGGHLDWKVRPVEELSGRSVLLIDDILDEGRTLSAIIDYCVQKKALEVITAVLVQKEHDRKSAGLKKADITGLVSPDRFLFGCGMDYKGYWRNAPGIYAVKGA